MNSFPRIDFKRKIPRRGFTGLQLYGGATVVSLFGLYVAANGGAKRRYKEKKKIIMIILGIK